MIWWWWWWYAGLWRKYYRTRLSTIFVYSTTAWRIYYYTTDRRSLPQKFLPERDYLTFGFLLSQIRLSSVTFVRPTQGVQTFGNISSPFCTYRVQMEIVTGNSSDGSVKHKRPMVDLSKAISHTYVTSHLRASHLLHGEFLVRICARLLVSFSCCHC